MLRALVEASISYVTSAPEEEGEEGDYPSPVTESPSPNSAEKSTTARSVLSTFLSRLDGIARKHESNTGPFVRRPPTPSKSRPRPRPSSSKPKSKPAAKKGKPAPANSKNEGERKGKKVGGLSTLNVMFQTGSVMCCAGSGREDSVGSG